MVSGHGYQSTHDHQVHCAKDDNIFAPCSNLQRHTGRWWPEATAAGLLVYCRPTSTHSPRPVYGGINFNNRQRAGFIRQQVEAIQRLKGYMVKHLQLILSLLSVVDDVCDSYLQNTSIDRNTKLFLSCMRLAFGSPISDVATGRRRATPLPPPLKKKKYSYATVANLTNILSKITIEHNEINELYVCSWNTQDSTVRFKIIFVFHIRSSR